MKNLRGTRSSFGGSVLGCIHENMYSSTVNPSRLDEIAYILSRSGSRQCAAMRHRRERPKIFEEVGHHSGKRKTSRYWFSIHSSFTLLLLDANICLSCFFLFPVLSSSTSAQSLRVSFLSECPHVLDLLRVGLMRWTTGLATVVSGAGCAVCSFSFCSFTSVPYAKS